MTHDSPTEFPEQRFTQELTRISAKLQRGDRADHSLVELFDVLIHYSREIDCDPQRLIAQVQRFSEPTDGSLGNHRLSILMEMLQDIQTELRCRVLNLAERLEAHDAARQANASYGGVAHRKNASQTPHAFHHQS